jgi:hypothetical protein
MFLEALNHGLIMHEMAGFDPQKARVSFNIHEEFEIGIMIALGYQDTFCHHFNACLGASRRYVMRFGYCLMNRLYIYDTTSIISNFMLLFFHMLDCFPAAYEWSCKINSCDFVPFFYACLFKRYVLLNSSIIYQYIYSTIVLDCLFKALIQSISFETSSEIAIESQPNLSS